MGLTPTYDLPFPASTDPPAGADQIQALAEATEAALAQLEAVIDLNTPGRPEPGDLKVVGYPVTAGSEPSGWLLCDGRAVSRTTYAALFAKLGTAHGAGDGATTFNLPDQRGRAIIGAGTGPGLTARALGAKGGEEKHALQVSELPPHNHGGGLHDHGGISGGPHTHSFQYAPWTSSHGVSGWIGPYIGTLNAGPQGTDPYDAYQLYRAGRDDGTDGSHTHAIPPQAVVANQGDGQGAAVMQPFVVLNLLIKS